MLSIQLATWSAICACSRFLYLFGGIKEDSTDSDQVLRYDPLQNSIEMLSPMKTPKACAAAIFHQGCLYVMGGRYYDTRFTVEKYDPETNMWTALAPMKDPHHASGITALEGKLYACGNYTNSNAVKAYDPATNSWQTVASTKRNRYFSVLIAHEGKLLAIGGKEEKTVEVYDPSKDQWQIDAELASGLQIENIIGGLIP